MSNEAHARIKINKLLEDAGWRFFDNEQGKANILLENHVKLTQIEFDAWGNDFEKIKSGSLDFLLVDSNFKPTCYRLQCFLARLCGNRAILASPRRNNYMLESLIHFLIERRPPMIMNFQLIICSFFFLVVDHLVLSVDDFRDIIKALVIGKSSNSKILTALPR